MKYAVLDKANPNKVYFIDGSRKTIEFTISADERFDDSDIVELADDAVEQAYNGDWYLTGNLPEVPAEVVMEMAKSARARAVEDITSTINGNVYEGDEVSQGRMARAVVFAIVKADMVNTARKIAYEQAIAELTPEEAEAVPKPVYDNYLDYTIPWVTEDNQVIQTTIGQLGTAGGDSMLIQAGLWTVPYES